MINIKPRQLSRYSFLVLFPVFFVLHSVNEYNIDPLHNGVFQLMLVYTIAMVSLCFLAWLVFRNLTKAAIFSFTLMAFNFFFGLLQDFLKKNLAGTIMVKYSFILTLFLLVFVVLFIYLRRSKNNFEKLCSYLNYLFILLLFIDLVQIGLKENKTIPTQQISSCKDCAKPDIYLIIADEYAGAQQLRDQFGFDNSSYEKALQERGFHVLQNTRANYNFTMHSMASMLNLDYLHGLNGKYFRHDEVFICRRMIEKNVFTSYLEKEGYKIYNYSFFDLEDHPKIIQHYYFTSVDTYINRQTLLGRMNYDLGFHLASKEKKESIRMNDDHNNKLVMQSTMEAATEKSQAPKFVYTHFTMPHHPYYYDRNEKPLAFEGLSGEALKKAYTEYLQYANGKFLQLIDTIQSKSATPPVIIFMSDHGFRQFKGPEAKKYYFMNINAISLPGKNYSRFYDGMTNVNMIRALSNEIFRQQFPMLKDETIFLEE